MAQRFSIPYHLVASGGATGFIDIYEVKAGMKFKTESVYVSFPNGTYHELEIAIFRGAERVAPSVGTYVGDGNVIEDEFFTDYSSGEKVRLYYKNNNSTQTRECFVIVRGFIE